MVALIMPLQAHLSISYRSLREHTLGTAWRWGIIYGCDFCEGERRVNSSLSWPTFLISTTIYILPKKYIFTSGKYLLSYSNNTHQWPPILNLTCSFIPLSEIHRFIALEEIYSFPQSVWALWSHRSWFYFATFCYVTLESYLTFDFQSPHL